MWRTLHCSDWLGGLGAAYHLPRLPLERNADLNASATTALGWLASLLATSMFLPQLVRTYRIGFDGSVGTMALAPATLAAEQEEAMVPESVLIP